MRRDFAPRKVGVTFADDALDQAVIDEEQSVSFVLVLDIEQWQTRPNNMSRTVNDATSRKSSLACTF